MIKDAKIHYKKKIIIKLLPNWVIFCKPKYDCLGITDLFIFWNKSVQFLNSTKGGNRNSLYTLPFSSLQQHSKIFRIVFF